MRRPRWRFVLPVLGVCVVVLTAFHAAFAPAAVTRTAAVEAAAKPKVSVITVSLGKPTELAFKLSKTSMVSAGAITFKVTNLGVAYHNFVLCTKAVATAASAKNACVGKKTAILKPKQTATLTVLVPKTGKYEFLCSVTGHAAAGMKGLLGVGVAVTAAEQKAAKTAGGPASSTGGSGSTGTTGGTTGTTGTTGGTTGGTTTGGTTGGTTTGGTTAGGGFPRPNEVGPAVGCAPGVTVKASGNADADGDETGTEPDDQDGCV